MKTRSEEALKFERNGPNGPEVLGLYWKPPSGKTAG